MGLTMSDMEKRIQGRKIGEEVIAEYIHGEDEAWVAGFRRACENFVKKRIESDDQVKCAGTE